MKQFSGPRAKLRAVRRHGNAFTEELKRYIASNEGAMKVEPPGAIAEYVIYAEPKPFPEDLSIIVGDMVHQLRSALDVLACDLATWSGATNTKGVYFPIAKTEQGFRERTSKIAKLAPELREIITDRIKPYGNSFLVALNELANMDKHRALITAVPSIRNSEFSAKVPEGRSELFYRKPTPFETGRIEIMRVPYTSRIDIHVKVHFNVVFTVEPLIGEPVSETLTKIARSVEGIIAGFERLCFGIADRTNG